MYDVIFKNGNVVDVKNEQILQADIAVKDGKIAGIGHFSGENVIDCTGKYITPGFIDEIFFGNCCIPYTDRVPEIISKNLFYLFGILFDKCTAKFLQCLSIFS